MARVGILNCSNVTQDVGCSAFGCLDAVNNRTGFFENYKDDPKLELVGIVNCAGCPTAIAPEKLLNRIKTLALLGIEAIHISACVINLCPFKNKYKSLLEEKYPDIKIVMGTHHAPEENAAKMIAQNIKEALIAPKKTMPEIIQQINSN